MTSVAPAGVAFLAALVLTGWTGVLLLLTPSFVLLVLPPLTKPLKSRARGIYRAVTRFVQWQWMGFVALLIEHLFGVEVRVWGDAAAKAHEATMAAGESVLWFANHRTRIDWMLLWSVLLRTRTLDKVRIVLKAPLRTLPIFGWAMQHFVFLFLHRKWDDDRKGLGTLLPFLTATEPDTSYLIFPEGTDLSVENVAKSAAFATKGGLAPRKYSLHPRTTGWTFMLPLLRANLRAVYDVTIFYVDYAAGERPSEKALLTGRMPRALHFYIERIDISDVPDSSGAESGDRDQKLAAWMDARFTRKEALLAAFYEQNGALPAGAQPLFEHAQFQQSATMSFALIAAFWFIWLLLSLQIGWMLGWTGLVLAAVVALSYALSTAFSRGVDGFQVDTAVSHK